MDTFLIIILLLIIVIVALIVLAKKKQIIIGGSSKKEVLYHGSSKQLRKIEPRPSSLTSYPVAFATPNYTNAVIFSASWNDEDFEMWGSGDITCLAERYPGAFRKLQTVGYIHHVSGNFAKLSDQFGLSDEYVSKKALFPHKIDKINIYEYLQNNKQIMLQTYEQNIEMRNKKLNFSEPIFTGNILCNIVCHDPRKTARDFADIADCKIVGLDVAGKAHFEQPTILIGDLMLGDRYFFANCSKLFLNNIEETTEDFARRAKLQYRKPIYHYCKEFATVAALRIFLQDNILAQLRIKQGSTAKIIHVTGPSGVGKTTLAKKLTADGIVAIDTDDITNQLASQYNCDFSSVQTYKEVESIIRKHEANGAKLIVFCGLTIDFSVLAADKFVIKLDYETIYEQTFGRSLQSIIDNQDKVRHALANHLLTNATEACQFFANTQLRHGFPAFIPYRNGHLIPFYNESLMSGYSMLTADQIYELIVKKS